MKTLYFVVLILISSNIFSQPFLAKRNSVSPNSLKKSQLSFYEWSKSNNLAKTKNWKSFKRYEMDLQMHTNSFGEPSNQADYIDATVKNAESKNQKSINGNVLWYPIGANVIPNNLTGYMNNGVGRINCIAFHPTDTNTFYVGVAQGGLWKTSNCGQTWIPLTDNLPITRISDIEIDPNNTNIIYISVCDFEYIGFGLYLNGKKRNTHYGLGVYKTTNGGQSWQTTGLSFQLTDGDASLIKKIIVSPANSNKLLACGVNGLYASSNAGANWTKIMDTLFWDLQIDPIHPNTVYAASGWVMTLNEGSAGIHKSTDFGATWNLLPTNIPARDSVQRIKIAISPTDPNCIYAAAVNTEGGLYGIYKTTNAGTSWVMIYNSLNLLSYDEGTTSTSGQGNYDLALLVNPLNKDIVYIGGINIWGTIDGGLTFNPMALWTTDHGPSIHADIHSMNSQPGSNAIFVCSDGGIDKTNDLIMSSWDELHNSVLFQTVWQNLSDGMQISSFYRISSSKNAAGTLLAGAQDNGSFYFDGSTWSTVIGGDGMDNYINPNDGLSIIGSSQYGNFVGSYDGGASLYGVYNNVNSETGEWTTPIVADYNNPGFLYAGFANVVQSVDDGNTWSAISSFPQNPNAPYNTEISALAVSNSNSNYIYVSKRVRYEFNTPGEIYKTTDGGTTWINITTGIPDSLYYTSVEVSENDPNLVYVSLAGMSAGNKVYKSTNGGQTWINISYNLPNIPVNCIKYIPNSGNTMMIATDLGVYVLSTGSTTWVNLSDGLPNVIVSDIEFNLDLNKIYICTFGRGIWSTDLDAFVSSEKQSNLKSTINLYPNVNNGNFNITLNNETDMNDEIQLEIINIKGQQMYNTKIQTKTTAINNANLKTGMYFAKLRGKKTFNVIRFVVE